MEPLYNDETQTPSNYAWSYAAVTGGLPSPGYCYVHSRYAPLAPTQPMMYLPYEPDQAYDYSQTSRWSQPTAPLPNPPLQAAPLPNPPFQTTMSQIKTESLPPVLSKTEPFSSVKIKTEPVSPAQAPSMRYQPGTSRGSLPTAPIKTELFPSVQPKTDTFSSSQARPMPYQPLTYGRPLPNAPYYTRYDVPLRDSDSQGQMRSRTDRENAPNSTVPFRPGSTSLPSANPRSSDLPPLAPPLGSSKRAVRRHMQQLRRFYQRRPCVNQLDWTARHCCRAAVRNCCRNATNCDRTGCCSYRYNECYHSGANRPHGPPSTINLRCPRLGKHTIVLNIN